ncbi:MAG: hypothetical protein QM715_00440 [Nibricoccus sp.]
MEPLQLIQAKLLDSKDRSERVNYLVQVDPARVMQTFGVPDEPAARVFAISTAQAVISQAFSERPLAWEPSEIFTGELPTYDPLYEKGGLKFWLMPVVLKNEAYFYLVG